MPSCLLVLEPETMAPLVSPGEADAAAQERPPRSVIQAFRRLALEAVMTVSAFLDRVPPLLSPLSGGAGLVLVLSAAAWPSSAGDTPAGTHAIAGVRAAASDGAWGPA